MNLHDENDPPLYPNLGTTAHMINNTGRLRKFVPCKRFDKMFVGNVQNLPSSHIGDTTHGKLNFKIFFTCFQT